MKTLLDDSDNKIPLDTICIRHYVEFAAARLATVARQGTAWLGGARLGAAGQGKARLALH